MDQPGRSEKEATAGTGVVPPRNEDISMEEKDNMSLMLWISSYQNHAVYVPAYFVIACYCWNAATTSPESETSYASYLSCGLYYFAAAVAILALQFELAYIKWRSKLPPGDSGLPLVGHSPALIQNWPEFFEKYFAKYGNIVTVRALYLPIVVVSKEADVHWLVTQERKGNTSAMVLPHVGKILGEEAIFLKSGDAHKRLRKIFEPSFTPKAVRDYASAIDTITQETLAKWCESGEWRVARDWALLAMKIFFICAFGEASEERMVTLIHLFEKWSASFNSLIPVALPGTAFRTGLYYREALGNEMKDMIAEFKAKNAPDSEVSKKSVMGRLCYAVDDEGNPPTEQELIDNLRFFLVAGFDTTKATFGGISHFVKKDAKLEAALVEEVRHFKEPMDIDELKNQAPILNAVMAESWRLTAPLGGHTTISKEELHYKGYAFPKDTVFTADIQGNAVLNNELHPRASEFHYERWLPKDHPLYVPAVANTETVDYNVMNNKFRTFNMGTHACLGVHFAKLEVRIVMARLFQKYEIEIRNERVKRFPVLQRLNDYKLTKRA